MGCAPAKAAVADKKSPQQVESGDPSSPSTEPPPLTCSPDHPRHERHSKKRLVTISTPTSNSRNSNAHMNSNGGAIPAAMVAVSAPDGSNPESRTPRPQDEPGAFQVLGISSYEEMLRQMREDALPPR